MNTNIFEKYQKYILAFRLSGKKYFTLWGADLSDESQPDKYLCNKTGKLIVFKNISEISDKIKSYKENYFDKSNFSKFSSEVTKLEKERLKIYTVNIDFILDELYKMKFTDEFLKNEKFFNEFVDLMNLMGDYAAQFKDAALAKELWDKDFSNLLEHFYDLFLWKDPNYNYKNPRIKQTTLSKDKVVYKFELLLLNFSNKLLL